MPILLELTDRAGFREVEVAAESFWIGGHKSGCEVALDLPEVHGRVLEVAVDAQGRLRVRTEPGLPFPVRCATGSIGARFVHFLDGDVLNVGPALVKLRFQAEAGEGGAQELDPATLTLAPGSPVGSWYQTFMEMADNLEGLKTADRMVAAAMAAIVRTTGVDRVHVVVDADGEGSGDSFYLTRPEDPRAFRVSRSLVNQVRETGRVVHVPLAAADPVARHFQSVRSEGISAAVALPVQALGKVLGVMYADCVRDGSVLTAEDLQRAVFVSRMLASALGNRVLVKHLLVEQRAGSEHRALTTSSPACAEMVQRVKLYAPADYTVLLRGETGTGKEVVARALHDLSRRSKGPFVPVNCAAIPEQLMESMLFGHEKGSFTGAAQARRGHFEEAHGGTILLDEIGDMALELQAKILRVLQDRVVSPIGGRREIKVDVRILAATHQDLEQMVRGGRFRQDLYYRLRELEILLPPLRDRMEDLEMLCARFLAEAAEELAFSERPQLHPDVMARLQRHPYRGNIRELRHIVKGAALRAGGGPILVSHLDIDRPDLHGADAPAADELLPTSLTWKERLEAQEKMALQRTMEAASGNLTRAAELFGVPRTTYREKLVRHGLLEA
jgi:two-component system NtrC family response regulator